MELYFHIPFCVKKCLYCDFLSAPADGETKQKYMEALLTETVGSAPLYASRRVSTVFIGGGTPSTVPVHCIERLMGAVGEYYSLDSDAEVSMEVNPGTVSEEALTRFRLAGVNRLSIGLQSADNEELALLGRIHTWEQFEETFAAARRAGFRNINVDVMSALPGQSLEKYRNTLEKVLSLDMPPEHISAYSLILEEGTPLREMYENGSLSVPDEDTDRLMYRETRDFLCGRGYRRYEISNYAREGFACRHNSGYWRRENYAGFGIGAASLIDNTRFRNGEDMAAYLKNPLGCRAEEQSLSTQEQMEEFLFLGLRMTDGISCGEFRRLFGCSIESVYGQVIERNVRDGLLKLSGGQTAGERTEEGAGEGRAAGERTEEGAGEGRAAGERTEEYAGEDSKVGKAGSAAYLALTDRGLDLSNYVMAQFLL